MRRVWRSGTEIAAALRLVEAGRSDREVARATGIPHETVRAWRRGRVPERARRVLAGGAECDRCRGPAHDVDALPREAYAYLLGMYLGDGCIARTPKGGALLRIALDAIYPGIIASAREAVTAVKGGPLPHVAPHGVRRALSSRPIGRPGLACCRSTDPGGSTSGGSPSNRGSRRSSRPPPRPSCAR